MDPKVLDLIDANMPKFNPVLTNGFAYMEFEDTVRYYDDILKMTLKSIENRGVVFRGVQRVLPDELFKVLSGKSNLSFEIHQESFFGVKLQFDWVDADGKVKPFAPIYQFLLYTNQYNDTFIRGTQYSIKTVLCDRGLSVTKEDQIFVKIVGYKFKVGVENFTFNRIATELKPYRPMPISMNMPSNRFYSPGEAWKVNPNTPPTPLLSWYIFANYGFDKAMKEYGECDYKIATLDYLLDKCGNSDEWVIFTLTGKTNPKTLEYSEYSPDIAIAVRPHSKLRCGELSSLASQYVAALLYAVDVAPTLINPGNIDDKSFWMYLIGRCSIKNKKGPETIMRFMREHFSTMNEYLVDESIRRFAKQRIEVNNMYELFNYIINNRADIVRTTDRASVLHKGLSALEFCMDSLITSANRFKHEIKNSTVLNYQRVNRTLTSRFHLRGIENASKDANLTQESTPTDNPIVDYLLGIVSQSKVFKARSAGKGGEEFNPNDPANAIHASVAFGCSYQRVTDPEPAGRGYFNPCAYLTNDNHIAVKPELKELYEQTAHRLNFKE